MTAPVWWWLSFASETGFLGVAIVRATDMATALRLTWRLGINPGGEVAGWPIPEDWGCGDPPAHFEDRLLTKEEAAQLSAEWHRSTLVSTRTVEPDELGDVEVIDAPRKEGE